MEKEIVITCECGVIIPHDQIDYYNGTNEEGEEYGEVEAYCKVCKKEYKGSQWGEWESETEALECLKEYI